MMFTEEKIAKILKDIKALIEDHKYLFIFACQKAKFENWLQVELCGILQKYNSNNIIPEEENVDITIDHLGIEIKICVTNGSGDWDEELNKGVADKNKCITNDVNGVIKDFNSLKENRTLTEKAVIFIVFPATHSCKNWKYHAARIQKGTSRSLEKRKIEFHFKNTEIPGVIYFLKVE